MRYALTLEHDVKPPVTVRGDYPGEDEEKAMRRALATALKAHPRFNWSSLCLTLEKSIAK